MKRSGRVNTVLLTFSLGEKLLFGGAPVLEIMTVFVSSCYEPLVCALCDGIGMRD